MKTIKSALPVWFSVVWVAIPLFWNSVATGPYLLANVRGLQNAAISGPILCTLLVWAVILSIPKFQVSKSIYGAGGYLLAVGLFLVYFEGFERTGGYLLFAMGIVLLNTPEKNNGEFNSSLHIDPQAGQ